MIPSIQSKFLAPLLSGLALMSMFLLLPHNAKADVIPGTGVNCAVNSGIPGVPNSDCVDKSYTDVLGSPLDPLTRTDVSGTSPGFLTAPVAPSGAFWIARKGDVQAGSPGNVFEVRTIFSTFATTGTGNCGVSEPITVTCITMSGTLAANGPVDVAVDGFGNLAGPHSLTQLGTFSINVALAPGTTHTLDFIFSGCNLWPSCPGVPDSSHPGIIASEPVVALLVDPSWSLAATGTPLDTIPESAMLAGGGDVGVSPSSAVPEPGSLLLLGTGLLGMVCAARRKLLV